jgi:integrase
MRQSRRPFGGIERRGTAFRARYHGPDACRYEAPHLFAARIDAEYWLAEVHREIAGGNWRPPPKDAPKGSDLDVLSGFARRCLGERDLTPRTREEYDKLLEGLILPTLGKAQLRYLEPDQIRRWYSTVLSEDRPTQRKHAYALLRSILREAEEEGLIERNPCRIRNAGRVRRTRDIEPASPAELNRLLELPPRLGLPVLLAGWCGLRAGEVRGLRRRDLDLAEGVVHVRQAVTRTTGQIHVGPPKTAAGIRDVGIPPHLLPDLAKYVAGLPVTGRAGYLFPGRDGVSPMSEKALRYAYGRARKIIGRDDLTFHDMRHSAASLAGMTGATTAELKAMMGHATAGMVERYQHANKTARARLAQNMSKLADG